MTFQLAGSAPEIYEQVMVPLWFGRWAEALIDVVSLEAGERVLDVACGTGVTTRLAKRTVGGSGDVTGLDINAGMLTIARELAPGGEITWVESDVCRSGLPSDAFDVVISQHGYDYFPDKLGALREFRRVLARNGRMAFSVWDGHSVYTEVLCSALGKYVSSEIAQRQRGQRETPSAEQLSQVVVDAGFADVVVIRQELTMRVPRAREFVPLHLCSMPIASAFLSLSEVEKEHLIEYVERELSAYVQDDQLVYPDAVHVAKAVK